MRRSTLRAQIASALRDEIMAGRLPTGREFTVKEIAEQYGVSATPVREALVDLAAQGLLEVRQHRGFRVHEFTLADFRAMVDARSLVFDGVFRRALARAGGGHDPHDGAGVPGPRTGRASCAAAARQLADPATLASVRRRAQAAERAALAGDLDVLIGYDLRYWRELGNMVGNPYAAEFLDRLRVQCWAFAVSRLRRERDLRGRLWAGHQELLAAVERADAATAERLIKAYDAHALELVHGLRARGEPSVEHQAESGTGNEGRSRDREEANPGLGPGASAAD
nr:GntR family transcriptional regulator [Streptomyces oceani]